MRAMLVTAGFGTRLAPLTDLLPKPAVPVANKPLAWFALDHLCRAGVRDFVLNTHHLADVLRAELEHHAPREARLSFVHEPAILGTGGGIRNAWRAHPDEPLLTMNGKLLFAPDVQAAMRVHEQSGAIATMVLKPMPEGAAFGTVEIDAEGRVRRLLGEPPQADAALRRMMYTGVQILAPRAFRDLPEQGCVIRDAYQHWLARGERIMSVEDPAPFRDAGISHWHYWEANMSLLSGETRWPSIAPDASHNLLSPQADPIPSSARVTHSVVGPFATIAPNIELDRCILWPGTEVAASLTNAIVLPTITLQVGAP